MAEQKQEEKKPEAPKAPEAKKPDAPKPDAPKVESPKPAPKAEELSKSEQRAKDGSHPSGFQNHTVVEPVASKMDPKKYNAPKEKK